MGRPSLRMATALAALAATLSSCPVLAATTYTDPAGDALFNAPAYEDIIAGSVDETAGLFEFTLTVAAAIPEAPRLTAPGVQGTRWVVSLDLDPSTAPVGWPFAPADEHSAQRGAAEAFIAVEWNGADFSGTLYDRRPLLSGSHVVTSSVPFEIVGDQVHMWLDSAEIGNPDHLGVNFVTVALTKHLDVVDLYQIVDVFPTYNQWP
jgi:hypothetical protein